METYIKPTFTAKLAIMVDELNDIFKEEPGIINRDGKNIQTRKILFGKFKGRKITEYGDILALRGNKFVKHHSKTTGYEYFEIADSNGKSIKEDVHVTVAKSFLPNPKNHDYVIHIDGNVKNNHYKNLKWFEYPELEHEKFKNIPFFSNYKIAKDSTIQSYFNDYPLLMKPFENEKGYMTIKLVSDDGVSRNMFIHRLVALTYIPNPDDLPEVDHRDRNKKNNCLENLRWVTSSENSENKSYERSISQFNLDESLIRHFKSAKEAVNILNLDISPDILIECADKNKNENENENEKSFCGGFIWKYKKKELFVPQEGEISVQLVKDFSFRDINFPEHYITNFGNVFNSRGYKLSPKFSDICPFYNFQYKNNVMASDIHVLVALFFVKGRTNKKCWVNHIDETRSNPRFDNLEWVTPSENTKNSIHKRFKAVHKIDPKTKQIIKTYESIADAAKDLNINNWENIATGISRCARGFYLTSHKFEWKFVDEEDKNRK